MCLYHDVRGTGQRQAPTGMDSPAMGHQTGVSACTPLIHTGGRYFGHLHGAAMYPWISCKIPDHKPSAGHSIASVHSRQHILLAWVLGAPRIHPAAKQGEVLGCQHRIVLGGIRPGICSTGHTRRLAPHPIPGLPLEDGRLCARD